MNSDLNLDQVEFSALPSGLHLVEQDVVCVLKKACNPWLTIPDSLTSFLDTLPKMINKAFASSVAAKQLNTANEGSDSVLLVSCSPNHADRVLGDMSRH
jgi:hypothetical protein